MTVRVLRPAAPVTPDPPTRPAAVPARPSAAVGYVCAPTDGTSDDLFIGWCERRAAADGWTLTTLVTDTDELQPLAERPGWQHIIELAAAGGIGAVVTISRPMIGLTGPAWAKASDRLAHLGVTLVTLGAMARTPPLGEDR